MALLDQTVQEFLWDLAFDVVDHVDPCEVPWWFGATLGIKLKPHFREGPVFEARHDVGDGARANGLEHHLHGRGSIVPIEFKAVFRVVETGHFASAGPMHLALHAVAEAWPVFMVREERKTTCREGFKNSRQVARS